MSPSAPPTRRRRARLPGPQGLVIVAAAVVGARIGLRPISDNSTLVHLRTGIDLVHSGHVPRSDPYSFTAFGHPWVVQSWLASLLYGLADAVGHHALVFEQAAIMAAVAAVVALTARAPTAWRSGLAAALAIGASAPGWSPRPLMFELLCLALLILIVERGANPLWLVPVMWVWVNTHGSWPVGLVWLGARAVGEAIDVRGWPRVTLVRVAGFAAGLAVAFVNPLSWRLLTFPFVAIQKRPVFQTIVEWRSPNFQDPNTVIALVFIVLALLVLLRAALPWAQLLPVAAFLALALVAERNLGPFGVVLAPALASALSSAGTVHHPWARRVTEVGRSAAWRWAVLGVAGAIVAGLVTVTDQRPVLSLGSYPVAATAFLQRSGRLGPGHRIAAADVVGCYLIWRAGPSTRVFIDDRYDMYPVAVVDDAAVIAGGGQDAEAVLDRRGVDTIVWRANGLLPGVLLRNGAWRQTYDDGTWTVLERQTGETPA